MWMLRAGSALALMILAVPVRAQHASTSVAPAGYAPEMATVMVPATSTPVTSTPAVGTTVLGPFTPQLGRDIWLLIKGTWAGTISVGTSPATDACATIFNPLTVAGATWASFTANANEVVSTPTRGATPAGAAAPVYCVKTIVSSGAPTVEIRQ